MSVSSYRALFGYVDGTIENFTVKGEINATDSSGVVGGLDAGGTIEDVISYVNVTSTLTSGQTKVAGFVVATKSKTGKPNDDANKRSIINCKNYGDVTCNSTTSNDGGGAGGFVGYCAHVMTITDCENYGDIKGYNAGGLAARGGRLTVTGFTNSGSITATGNAAGGLIGDHDNNSCGTPIKLTDCKNTGVITGTDGKTGGMVGNTDVNSTNIIISDSCSTTGNYKLVGSWTT